MTDELKTRRSRRRAAAPTTADPIEIALEAEASGASLGDDSPARRVLLKHEQLLGWQIMKERAGFGLRILTGVVGVVAAVVVGTLVWEASQERGLVIEPFSVPPEFAARGVTGQVVASRLLDRLSEMSDQTVSVRAPSTYANNWNGDIKVQIPQTGVSVGELRRYLVEWLGKQTTIGGELYRTPDGLSLVARTGTATATPQTGADERALDAMIQAAAEQVYAITQPYRYAVYLGRRGDDEGAAQSEAVLRRLIQSEDQADRMWAYTALNLRLQAKGDTAGAIAAASAAIAIDPRFNLAYANRAGAYEALGQDEAAYLDQKLAERMARQHGRRHMREEGLLFSQQSWAAMTRADIGDHAGAIPLFEDSLRTRPGDQQSEFLLFNSQAANHDEAAARETAARLIESLADQASTEEIAQGRAEVEMVLATYRKDWPQVVAQMGASLAHGAAITPRTRVGTFPDLAIALAHLGDVQRARRVIGGTPTACYRCAVARGVVAELSGDRARADRWLEAAVAMAPSLPFALEARGRVRLARGDLDGAQADFQEANRRSPDWADPLKGWGDVLMARNDARGAVRRYEAGLERAPQWVAARQALTRARGTSEAMRARG